MTDVRAGTTVLTDVDVHGTVVDVEAALDVSAPPEVEVVVDDAPDIALDVTLGAPGPPGADGPAGAPGPEGPAGPPGPGQEWHDLNVDNEPGPAVSGPVQVFKPLEVGDMGDGTMYLFVRLNGAELRWDDVTGQLGFTDEVRRITAPVGETPGDVLTYTGPGANPLQYLPPFAGAMLTVGQETHDRRYVNNAGITCANQIMRISYLTARKSETITAIRVTVGNTPMSGTAPTTIQLALFEEDPSTRALTQVALTANNTGLFTVANTAVTVPFASSVPVVAGHRYACALLVVGAGTLATYAGVAGTLNTELHLAPRMIAQRTGVPSMPTGITDTQLNAAPTGNAMYFALVP